MNNTSIMARMSRFKDHTPPQQHKLGGWVLPQQFIKASHSLSERKEVSLQGQNSYFLLHGLFSWALDGKKGRSFSPHFPFLGALK
jgi:hypothetical protein